MEYSICIFFPIYTFCNILLLSIYTFLQQYEPILKHIDTMINYVLSFNDESNKENTNKYQTATYIYLKATGLTENQL